MLCEAGTTKNRPSLLRGKQDMIRKKMILGKLAYKFLVTQQYWIDIMYLYVCVCAQKVLKQWSGQWIHTKVRRRWRQTWRCDAYIPRSGAGVDTHGTAMVLCCAQEMVAAAMLLWWALQKHYIADRFHEVVSSLADSVSIIPLNTYTNKKHFKYITHILCEGEQLRIALHFKGESMAWLKKQCWFAILVCRMRRGR